MTVCVWTYTYYIYIKLLTLGCTLTCSDAHLMPGVAQVVSIGVGDHDKCLNGVNVLLFHLCDTWTGCEQRKPGQGLDVSISLQLQREWNRKENKTWQKELNKRGLNEISHMKRVKTQTCMLKMQAILIAQRIPSRQRDATSWSSQSWSPTLNAASRGVQASCFT